MVAEVFECDYVRYSDCHEEFVIESKYYDDDMGELIETGHGWLARLTMPGYLDSTEYGVYETELEALDDLLSMYGNETGDDEYTEQWELDILDYLREHYPDSQTLRFYS